MLPETKQMLEELEKNSIFVDIQTRAAKEFEAEMNARVLQSIMLEYEYPHQYDMYAQPGMLDWVEATIGSQSVVWEYAHGTYYFKRKKDLELFIMKWL